MRHAAVLTLVLLARLLPAQEMAWGTVTFEMPYEDRAFAYMGAMPETVLATIENGTYDKRFVKLSELRYWNEEEERYRRFADD